MNTDDFSVSPDCEIVSSRIVRATAAMVFTAWTDPNHLKNWWGPTGFTNTFHEFDLRVGGKWRFTMHGPDKGHYENECEFTHIEKPTAIAWKRHSKPLFQVVATFEEISDHDTRIVFRMIFDSPEACNKLKKFVVDKNQENFDRLENELIKMESIMANKQGKQLSAAAQTALIDLLKTRFDNNKTRHPHINWTNVEAKLKANIEKLWSLNEMERTGGEPDVVGHDKTTGDYIFYDCAAESPKGRRSVCFDREGLETRKEHPPQNNAMDMASAMGIEILSEENYRELQKLGAFDVKTSSWIQTPSAIRKLGGALFADRRYDKVFVYHNGAQSYYAARGFRGALKV